MKSRAAMWIYVLFLHAVVGVSLVKTDILERTMDRIGLTKGDEAEAPIIATMREVHRQMDPAIPAGATIFLGDSLTMALATAAVAPVSVNYGIGWQRSDQLIVSMQEYASMSRADTVVVMIGTNDLLQGRLEGIESRFDDILALIPAGKIVMVSPPPVGREDFGGTEIHSEAGVILREAVLRACSRDPRCQFVDAFGSLSHEGRPAEGILLDDKIHLSPRGYELLIQDIKAAVGA